MFRRFFRFGRPRLNARSALRTGSYINNQMKKREGSEHTDKIEKDINRGIKKYEKRQVMSKTDRNSNFLTVTNIIVILIIIGVFFMMIREFFKIGGLSTTTIFTSLIIFAIVSLYFVFIERYLEKSKMQEELNEIRDEREKEHQSFLDRVKEIENIQKNSIESLILKDEQGYDRKTWKIGRAQSMLIGKKTPRNKVDVDLSESIYANLVSRAHGVLNKVNNEWYYEDIGSRNGSGLKRQRDGRKWKLEQYKPIKVESGDTIYIATTKILLK